MKKIIGLISFFLLLGSMCFAGDFLFWGEPGPTKTVYVDNVTRSLQSLYERAGGTWAYTDTAGMKRAPNQVFITCESKATRWAFNGTAATTSVGHVFPADSSWHLPGGRYIQTSSAIAGVATDNVTCQMTPEY